MSNTQISYPELIKMVHPDINPNVQDVGDKIATIKRHRDNPDFLYKLAVKWGFFPETKGTKIFTFKVGNVVSYIMDGIKRRAVIIDIQNFPINRYKVVIVDIVSRTVFEKFFDNINVSEYGGIEVIGKANETSRLKADFLYVVYKKKQEKINQILFPNRNYRFVDKWVYCTTLGRRIRVLRTTAKRVYYWCERTNKERFVKMSSVIDR